MKLSLYTLICISSSYALADELAAVEIPAIRSPMDDGIGSGLIEQASLQSLYGRQTGRQCPAGYPINCPGASFCCPANNNCRNAAQAQGCCPFDAPTCGGNFCLGNGQTCCSSNFYCRAGYQCMTSSAGELGCCRPGYNSCGRGYCCPPGTTCTSSGTRCRSGNSPTTTRLTTASTTSRSTTTRSSRSSSSTSDDSSSELNDGGVGELVSSIFEAGSAIVDQATTTGAQSRTTTLSDGGPTTVVPVGQAAPTGPINGASSFQALSWPLLIPAFALIA